MALSDYQIWFLTGSQHLYGPEAIEQVGRNSREIAAYLSEAAAIPASVVFKPVLTTAEEIAGICSEADNDARCIGVIAWMHTFSPAKNWIAGLAALRKPLLHLHTQYNRDIPWSEIDMDFMNLNQAAHGDREFGFIMSRLRLRRKVVVGHWRDEACRIRSALGRGRRPPGRRRGASRWRASATICARWRSPKATRWRRRRSFGYSVNGYGVGDLVAVVNEVGDGEIDALVAEYESAYRMTADLRRAARVTGRCARRRGSRSAWRNF